VYFYSKTNQTTVGYPVLIFGIKINLTGCALFWLPQKSWRVCFVE